MLQDLISLSRYTNSEIEDRLLTKLNYIIYYTIDPPSGSMVQNLHNPACMQTFCATSTISLLFTGLTQIPSISSHVRSQKSATEAMKSPPTAMRPGRREATPLLSHTPCDTRDTRDTRDSICLSLLLVLSAVGGDKVLHSVEGHLMLGNIVHIRVESVFFKFFDLFILFYLFNATTPTRV